MLQIVDTAAAREGQGQGASGTRPASHGPQRRNDFHTCFQKPLVLPVMH